MAQPTTRAVALGGCLVAAALTVGGCGRGPLNSPATGSGCSLTVSLPLRGGHPVAGAMATVGGRSTLLDQPTSTLSIPCGLTARLGPSARLPGAPPLTGWTVDGQTRHRGRIAVLIDGLITATLDVHLPAASPSGAVLPQSTSPVRSPHPSPSARPSPRPRPTPTAATVSLDRWLRYDAAARTVTLQLVAGYGNVNDGLDYNGTTSGGMRIGIPTGWTVTVDFSNVASLNHSAAVVTATGTTPVFAGAALPDPVKGVAPGGHATFHFVTGAAGSYRIACLVPGHEPAGMWAALQVTAGGVPTIHL